MRLELLKLTYTHGRDAAEAVARAKALEAFVFADEIARRNGAHPAELDAPKRGPGRPRKTDREPSLLE